MIPRYYYRKFTEDKNNPDGQALKKARLKYQIKREAEKQKWKGLNFSQEAEMKLRQEKLKDQKMRNIIIRNNLKAKKTAEFISLEDRFLTPGTTSKNTQNLVQEAENNE